MEQIEDTKEEMKGAGKYTKSGKEGSKSDEEETKYTKKKSGIEVYEGDKKFCSKHFDIQIQGYYFNKEGKLRAIQDGNR